MKIQNIARLGGNLEGCDCEEILQRLTSLEEGQCDCEAINQKLTNLENNITGIQNDILDVKNDITNIQANITLIEQNIAYIENAVMLSEVTDYWAPTVRPIAGGANPLFGIGVSAINIGRTYNFWGTGSLSGTSSLILGQTYYIVESGQNPEPSPSPPFPPLNKVPELLWYLGEPTTGTLWLEDRNHGGGAMLVSMPLKFDSTGIYFVATVPTGNLSGLQPGTTFKFTQSLILVDPNS